MGCASSKPSRRRANTAEEALETVADEVTFAVDGKAKHVHLKPTKSGRFLLGTSDEPMPEEAYKEMRTILEEDPEAAEKAHELAKAADMGLQIESAGSPAFIGVLVARVISASVSDFKNPDIQLAAEDDKSKRVKHNTAKGATNSDLGPPTSVGSDNAGGRDLHHTSSMKVREFTWDSSFKLVFVVVYSHAALKISMKDRSTLGMGMGPATAEGAINISELPQGSSRHTVPLHTKSKGVGTVDLEVDYNWMRGTHDDGKRVRTLSLTINRRKLKTLRNVVSHVSNVNHWMLSHDNVWAVLDEDHPALKRTSRVSSGAQGSGRPSFAHDSKHHHHSTSAMTSAYTGSSGSTEAVQLGQADLSGTSDGGKSSVPEMQPQKDGSTDMNSGKSASGAADQGVSDLSSQSSDAGLTRQQIAQRRELTQQYDVVEGSKQNPHTLMFEYSILDSLKASEDDSAESANMKSQLAGIFALVNDRLSTLEDTVRSQHEMLMELSYQVDSKENGPRLPFISGKFSYGLGRPAVKRSVLLFASRSQAGPGNDRYPCAFMGQHRTDSNGTLGPIHLPDSMVTTPGHYNVLALLPEDNTFARGSLFILKPGTKCVMFDLDGTITTGDHEVVAQFALNAVAASLDAADRMLTQNWDQKSRAHARTVCRLWAAKGYQVIYLSGRQGSFYNLTLSWLIKHHFPPGPIHLTRTHVPTLPVYISVGNFKVQYMESLQKKGFELYAAYGNTGTDVRAYEAAGIPKERTFTIGQAAGYGGTQRIQNFTRHLAQVVDFPDSDVPVPYVDLLYVALPQYRSGSTGKKVRADSDTCGAISGAAEFREEFAASALQSGAADKAVEDAAADEFDLGGPQPVDVNVTEDDDDESGDDG